MADRRRTGMGWPTREHIVGARYRLIPLLALAACTTAAAPPEGNGQANITPTQPPFRQQELAKFDAPFALAFLPDGAVLVTEKAGMLKMRAPDGSIADVSGVPTVVTGGQGGLLDVAIAPDFATSGYGLSDLFRAADGQFGTDHGARQTGRRHRSSASARPVRRTQCFRTWRCCGARARRARAVSSAPTIAFAPDGQSLFLSSGERQRFTPAQDPDQALGKILHLTLDGQPVDPGKAGSGNRRGIRSAEEHDARRIGADAPDRRASDDACRDILDRTSQSLRTCLRCERAAVGSRNGAEGRRRGESDHARRELWLAQGVKRRQLRRRRRSPRTRRVTASSRQSCGGTRQSRPGGMMIYSGGMWPAWRGSMFVAALSGKALIRVALNGDKARSRLSNSRWARASATWHRRPMVRSGCWRTAKRAPAGG